MTPFRKASLIDYLLWFNLAQMNGMQPTHYYDRPFDSPFEGFLVAKRDFTMGGECGAAAAHIIVPNGYYAEGAQGHNQLYYLDPVRITDGCSWIPIYNNKEFRNFPGITEFIREQEMERRRFEQEVYKSQDYKPQSDIGKWWKRGKC